MLPRYSLGNRNLFLSVVFTGDVRSRLDFMAADSGRAAFSEKESGVREGEAIARIARENRAEPQWWEHRRGGVTRG